MALQFFCEQGDGKQLGEGVQAVAHDGFQKGLGLDVVTLQDVPVKDCPIIGLKKFTLFRYRFLLDYLRKSPLFQIPVEGLQHLPLGWRHHRGYRESEGIPGRKKAS